MKVKEESMNTLTGVVLSFLGFKYDIKSFIDDSKHITELYVGKVIVGRVTTTFEE